MGHAKGYAACGERPNSRVSHQLALAVGWLSRAIY
jgi:hypothetical protein